MASAAMQEKFELIEELGAGGFAVTVKTRVLDPELLDEFGREIVVLKIPHRFKERSIKEEIENNFALFSRLHKIASPNIVQYLGFDVYEGKIVLIMEYVPGSLRELVGGIKREKDKPRKIIPQDTTIEIIKGVLTGLVVIHSEGILHRDIKPENVLLDGKTPKICDLGISRILSSTSSRAQTFAGSLFYMPPEIMDGTGASFTADIWSVGVTFYEMLTGRLPFGLGMDTPNRQIIDRICNKDPLPPSHYVDLPADLDRIVLKALQKNPQDRFPTAAEFIEALESIGQIDEEALPQILLDINMLIESGASSSHIEERLKEVCAQFPENYEPLEVLGEFYIRGQRYSDSIEVFKKATKLDPDNATLYWNLAIAYERLGEYNKAFVSLQRAMRIGLEPSLQRHASRWRQLIREKGESQSKNR